MVPVSSATPQNKRFTVENCLMNPVPLLLERHKPFVQLHPNLGRIDRRFSGQFARVPTNDNAALNSQLAKLRQQVANLEARLRDLPA
jgi:uncharacterized protein involved in exopolysaccharide biosynthesis